MRDASSNPNSDEAVLAEVVGALERQGSVVLDDYVRRYPHLAEEIRSLVRMQDAIADTRAGDDESVPAQLGEFRVRRLIARGGMGEVWEADQERLQRRVAVKVIRRGRISPQARDRFLREQEVLAKLHQTHIVSIHAAGEEGRLQYFVMPFIDWAALHHVVKAVRHEKTAQPDSETPSLAELAGRVAEGSQGQGPSRPAGDGDGRLEVTTEPHKGLPLGESAEGAEMSEPAATAPVRLSGEYFRSVAQVMADAAEAVQHAHDAGVLHRDLKPSNVMVDRSGDCWLIDFGLAGYRRNPAGNVAPGEGRSDAASEPAAVSGVMGTPHYMAPEQFESRADARSDVWGLGATLYELLTLRRAFDGTTEAEVRTRILSGGPPPPRAMVGNIPADLAAISLKALRREPGERYLSAGGFAADLRHWLNAEPTMARPAGLPRKAWLWAKRDKWRATATLVSTLAVLLGVLAGFVALLQANEEVEKRADYAEDLAQERESEVRLLQLQRSRYGLPRGWSKERLAEIQEHYKNGTQKARRKGRDEAAATLAGLDAVSYKTLLSDAGSLVFRKDGKRLLMGGVNQFSGAREKPGGVYDWDADKFTPSQLPPGMGPVAFSPDGTPLQLVATGAYTLRLWDADRQRTVRDFTVAPKLPPMPLAGDSQPALGLSADGRLVAASTILPEGKATLMVWEAVTEKEVLREAEKVEVMAFSPDSALLATGDKEGRVKVRSLKDPKEVTLFRRDRLEIQCLAFARDYIRREGTGRSGWLLAAGEVGGNITIWDVDRKLARTQCPGSTYEVTGVAFSPDSTLLASVGRNAPRVWDVVTGRLLLTLESKTTCTDVVFSPDGQYLVVSAIDVFGRGGGVEFYNLDYGRGVRTLRGLRGRVERISLSRDGRYLAALSHEMQLGVWNRASGQLLHVLEAPAIQWADNAAFAFSPDGNRLACVSWREAVWWDVGTGKAVGNCRLPPGLGNSLAFQSPDKLLLFRVETEDMKHSPDSGAPADKFPRVCRVHDLLAKDAEKPLYSLLGLVWFDTACPEDGSYFVAHGFVNTKEGRKYHYKAFESRTGKLLLDYEYDGKDGRGAAPMFHQGGKLLAFRHPGQEAGTFMEMPTGTPRGALSDDAAIDPAAEWWGRAPTADSSKQWFGVALYRRGTVGPVVTFSVDTISTGKDLKFDKTGTSFAWGTGDGTVLVYDLPKIRRRLASVGLGW
jgi:serine/threonine protein kinase/WD40 repeat protein